MRSTLFRFATAAFLVCASLAVSAQSAMRCGSKIIDVGMTMAEVVRHCGEPASREVEEHDVRAGNRVVGTTQLNRLTYRQSGSITRMLEFDQDKLIAIKLVR